MLARGNILVGNDVIDVIVAVEGREMLLQIYNGGVHGSSSSGPVSRATQ